LRLPADENCPRSLVVRLRERGHDVVWIREVAPGAPDEAVLLRARSEDRVLLTFDKDFGEIAFRVGLPPTSGAILLRISLPAGDAVATTVADALDAHPGWKGAFSVVEDSRVRRRQLD
jgi:predicted nuclease of predicted toxin-antitoxin system